MLLHKTFQSSTFQFALLAIGVFGALVIGFLAYIYHSASTSVQREIDHAIEFDRRDLLSQFAQGGSERLDGALRERIGGDRRGAAYLHADSAYNRLAGNLDQWPASLADVQADHVADIQGATGDLPLRVETTTLPDGSHLLVGRATDGLRDFTREMAAAVALTLGFICLLAAVATYRITRRTVARIESINVTSRAIMDRGLSMRIPLRGTNDEWDQLASNLNSMLDRIETLLAEVKQVSENVAHDLRTPLTRMRGRLEATYTKATSDQVSREAIADTLSDLDNVLRMFSSVMRISRIEATERYSGFEPVNLAAIAQEVAELFEPAVQEAGGSIRVKVAGDVEAVGDRDLLFDALSNLIDNAIKYAGDALEVIISVASAPALVVLSVTDNGPGIPAEDLPHVLRRFYRVEKWRSTPGHGLGLSLVAAVARIHRGQVSLINRRPGLEVRIELPRGGDQRGNAAAQQQHVS